ncbi:MAG: trypsin-like peptidase domain-containing protein [Lachnospiraceae bacterium]|nr:trypsin-like peptidase domain-containing protein [Lachnospiraceae bacterium]
MTAKKEKKAVKVILRVLLIVALAIIVGFGGSIGYQIYRAGGSDEQTTVIGSPVINEIGSGSEKGYDVLTPTAVPDAAISPLSLSTNDVSAVVETMTPAVVAINCKITYTQESFWGMPQTYSGTASGTGFFVSQSSDKLYIATNNHVVADAQEITVTLCNEKVVPAETVGTDPSYDLAVISVNLSDLSEDDLAAVRIASLGDSDTITVGSMSIAIGNALGYGQSTTVGYISALNREVTVEGNTNSLIQTDTAINPGNSGGPLLNVHGQVIGINSVKYSDTSVEGMGYAIPINTAIPIINDLIDDVTLDASEIGYLGIEGKDVTESYSTGFGMPVGVYVFSIAPNSPAAASELREGDIITAINGRKVSTMEDLKNRISKIRAGETAELTVQTIRAGRYEEHTVTVTLAKRPD